MSVHKREIAVPNVGKKMIMYEGELDGQHALVFVKDDIAVPLINVADLIANALIKGKFPPNTRAFGWDKTSDLPRDEFYRYRIAEKNHVTIDRTDPVCSFIRRFVEAGDAPN